MRNEEVMQILRDPVAQRLLESPIARLAYNGPDGTPRVVPIGFLWTGATVVLCTATDAPKVRSLERDPKVAFTIDTDTHPPNILSIRGTAAIEIVEGVPDEFLTASRKGVPQEQWSDFEQQARSLYPAMARITVTPTWANVIDFETRFPSAVERLVAGR